MWYLNVFTFARGFPRWLPAGLYTTIFQHYKCIIIKICIFRMLKWHIDIHVSEVHTYFTLITYPLTRQHFGSSLYYLIFYVDVIFYVDIIDAEFEQVRTPFGLLMRKPHFACRCGSIWRTSSSVPSTCLSWLKRVKWSWQLAIKAQKFKCTIQM